MSAEVEIDDSLYSRQRYVLGDGAMQRMAKSKVLLCGAGGLGIEIAKNIVLAGIKSLTVQDSKAATYHDLGTQFFLREEDVKKGSNRAEASAGRLAELNPYVSVTVKTDPLDDSTDLEYLKDFQCIIVTELPLSLQLKINTFCREQEPPIPFISADVYGVFCWCFCDLGSEFTVDDPTGEEAKEIFIGNITKENPAVLTALRETYHNLETGDKVTFKEINGMTALNGRTSQVKVVNPCNLLLLDIDSTSDEFAEYEHGGILTQVKIPKVMKFESLEQQLKKPEYITADLSRFDAPASIHLGLLGLHKFQEKEGRLPNLWCTKDADVVLQLVKEAAAQQEPEVENVDEELVRQLSFTAQGCFAPLCAALGGFVAQEALKSITGKFTPLSQWLYLDAAEVLTGLDQMAAESFHPRGTRYDALRGCIGDDLCQQLSDLRLFMVGCGAIGCEMLKNYAMLGVGTSPKGQVTITDNDLIEKSNLNRQFLFRPHHIRKPKSTTAAQSTKDINPEIQIEAQQHKVCPQTEASIYNDGFFESQNVMVNALDNIEARRYMDSRCVTNQRPLLESGTMGTKGHVQVIVPHVTESYSTQRDPPDEDIPYCTLKSFPAVIEHCIQWARDKFESSFTQKPAMFNRFWSTHQSPAQVVQVLKDGDSIEGVVQVSKLLHRRPSTWADCVLQARLKFEKYFNHKAKNLLHAFPLDTRLKEGSLFWQSPKRPPTPVVFDSKNEIHMSFIRSTAHLYADICGVKWTEQDASISNLTEILLGIKVPDFRPSSKVIETDETAKKTDESDTSGDDILESAHRIQPKINSTSAFSQMFPATFEKDDDSNGHIDFITAASNLRASMYSIEPADRLKTKRIAGKIVPAIATTTAAVAGLVTIELLKLLKNAPLEHYKNCFMNLALPVMLFSEPGATQKQTFGDNLEFTPWDRWEVHGNKDFTLQNFIQFFQDKYDLEVALVVQGVKMIYMPIMPGHKKRIPHSMVKLLKRTPGQKYSDLVVSYKGTKEEDMGPPVRYFFDQ